MSGVDPSDPRLARFRRAVQDLPPEDLGAWLEFLAQFGFAVTLTAYQGNRGVWRCRLDRSFRSYGGVGRSMRAALLDALRRVEPYLVDMPYLTVLPPGTNGAGG